MRNRALKRRTRVVAGHEVQITGLGGLDDMTCGYHEIVGGAVGRRVFDEECRADFHFRMPGRRNDSRRDEKERFQRGLDSHRRSHDTLRHG